MVTTSPAPHRRAHSQRVRRIAFGLVVLVALGGALLVSLTREPMRAAIWQRLGQHCGTVSIEPGGGRLADPATARREEACFMHSYAHCQAASLDDVQRFLDGSTTDTFVVEPDIGSLTGCAVADALRTVLDGGGTLTRTERCTGVAQQPDGLRVLGCGALGDIVISSS